MSEQVDVYYEGWGERWLWGRLRATTALGGRSQILFEYSAQAKQRGVELSAFQLPLAGPALRQGFPAHQLGLPGPVYDALPDGWGMLLMNRLFKRRGLNAARIGPLQRLAYIGDNAMGAMTFEPLAPEGEAVQEHLPLELLLAEVQEVLAGEGGEFLQTLLQLGGSPQGARPKALIYRDPGTGTFTTVAGPDLEAWLIKFPARHEHPEVCAVEAAYADCLRLCGIQAADTRYFSLPDGQAAFATRRFDRVAGQRVPMQSLAAFTGANYQEPGALDYVNFLRATHLCTNDVRQKAIAFERAVFNVVFNNRDDHPKNFAYLMSATGTWTLAPAYDVTFCEGPHGHHQMDVLGESLDIQRAALLGLADEAEVPPAIASDTIERIGKVASQFTVLVEREYPGTITRDTLKTIQGRLDENLSLLR